MDSCNQSTFFPGKGVLRILKRSMVEWLILLIMLWPFLIRLFSNLAGPLSYLQYAVDAVLLGWGVIFLVRLFKRPVKIHRRLIPFVLLISGFILYTLFIYCCQYQSILYYMWGFRNTFRFYIIFLIVVSMVRTQEAEAWLKLLDKLFWPNAVLSVLQFTVGGYSQDQLGGIFGTVAGNGFTLIFLSIVVAKSQLLMYEKKEKLWICLLKCATALLIAAMAELKFFFLLFVLLLVMVAVLTEFSWKKVIALIFCAAAAAFFMDLLVEWFGSSKKFDLEGLIAKAFQENYATANDLNRLSAIQTLSKKVVTNPLERIVGLGLGNCEKSNFALLRTPFYERFSYLHYNWFAAPMIFLETGYVGLAFYLGFFIMCFWHIAKKMKEGIGNVMYCRLGVIFAVIAVILAFYNSSMKHEAGIMIYIVMAIPLIPEEHGIEERRKT